MKRFKERRLAWIQKKINRATAQIEQINARLPYHVVDSPSYAVLERRRVSTWWKRNDLYEKKHRLKEAA